MIKTARNIKTYKKGINEALNDRFLRSSLDKFCYAYRESRQKIFEGIGFEEIKEDITSVKANSLSRIMELFEEFRKHAEESGAVIHIAKNAGEANGIISKIASDNNVRHIVKAKSMTAEEVFLNDHLEKTGFKVTETDLGEWIIQLRHEGPSHMVMPAIHLSRYQVGDLFEKVTHEKNDPEDIERLVKIARKELRSAFLEADMGITGANFAIADSGTLGLVTNEGNARLVTTLPKIHVALVGFEKLIPDLQSALQILEVLPRNATGQTISSYVTWIKGANECKASSTGRKIMHIIFLDNGRLAMARNPVFREALRCIRCGACANVCPVYSKIGGHQYGHVYIGAIGLILTFFFHGSENDRAIVRNCINCLACREVCPAGIDLPFIIKKTYGAVLESEKKRPLKNRILNFVMKNRKLFHFLLRKSYLLQRPFPKKGGMIRHLPHFFEKNHGFRSLPVIARKPFRDQWPLLYRRVSKPDMRVGLFAGCAVDFIYPEQGKALIQVLRRQNIQIDFPVEQSCCGLPLMMVAEEETAKSLALKNLKAFGLKEYDYVLTLCASCASHLKHNYVRLFQEESILPAGLRDFCDKVIDFSSFMINIFELEKDAFEVSDTKVAYHAPCHLCRGMKITDEPRQLIDIAGYTYMPSMNEEVCCGFGGSYSLDFPEISAEILRGKLSAIQESGAHTLVTDCPGCVLQLRGGMDKQGGNIRVKHIAELVAENEMSHQR